MPSGAAFGVRASWAWKLDAWFPGGAKGRIAAMGERRAVHRSGRPFSGWLFRSMQTGASGRGTREPVGTDRADGNRLSQGWDYAHGFSRIRTLAR